MKVNDICEPIFKSMNREIEPLPLFNNQFNNNNQNNKNNSLTLSSLNISSSSTTSLNSNSNSNSNSNFNNLKSNSLLNDNINLVIKSKANIHSKDHNNNNNNSNYNNNNNNYNNYIQNSLILPHLPPPPPPPPHLLPFTSSSSFAPPPSSSSSSSSRHLTYFILNISLNDIKKNIELFLKKYISVEYQFNNWTWRISTFHNDKFVVFSLILYSLASVNDSYFIEGNLLEGDLNLYHIIFNELKSNFNISPSSSSSSSPSSSAAIISVDNTWDDCFSVPDDFLDMEQDMEPMTNEIFSQSLGPINSLLNSPFIDMKTQGIQALLENCVNSSYEIYFAQLTVNENFPHYFLCIKLLIQIILTSDLTLPINKKNIALSLGCLAHLSKYQYTKQYLQSRYDFISAFPNLLNQPLNILQCQTIQYNIQMF